MSTAPSFDEFSFRTGGAEELTAACSAPGLPVFSEQVLGLLDDLSHALRALPESRSFPDLAAFAFWCRRASLTSMAGRYREEPLYGRGLALQITPGNVPLNFAYSLAAGLLAGNANAVRLPSERFPQADLFCRTLVQVILEKHTELAPYAVCFRCGHDSPALAALSAVCAVRVIWGGDDTIAQLRSLPMPPRAVELTFADRYSLCVMDSAAYLASDDKDALAKAFYQDAYWSDQLACTAPRALLWLGGHGEKAGEDFWPRVSGLARREYPMPDVMAVKKREAALMIAERCAGARLQAGDNYTVRVKVPSLEAEYFELCPGSGFFLECEAESIEALRPAAGEKCQTATSFGVSRETWEAFFASELPRGVDRVVAPGHSMDFALHWDGYDLIRTMSRSVTIL